MKKYRNISITKASGEIAPFSAEKLRTSLQRAGASEAIAKEITNELGPELYEGISTKKIYQRAFTLLRERSGTLAAKYHLKKAIMELGPSGYPFERFVGEILKYQGYETKVGQLVQGKCVGHEIDVIARKEDQLFMIECKYHNRPGTVCDVKIPLYIQARFKDVEEAFLKLPERKPAHHQGWVVTNTRFTQDAVQYGTCAGLKLMGWDYPNGGSLRSSIDSMGLYPITCLNTLSRSEKQRLLENKIVLAKELHQNEQVLLKAGIKPAKAKAVMQECGQLCESITSYNKAKK